MRNRSIVLFLLISACIASLGMAADKTSPRKIRMLVVSSYHREYTWSQDTSQGFSDAMLAYGYFDNREQLAAFAKTDQVETSKVVVKKVWMDAKRKKNKVDLEAAGVRIYKLAKEFHPDLLFLADDEAGEYVGKPYLDTKTPVVFWGFNDNPVKYGLVDSAGRPGHNVTGVYQSGYYVETLRLLKSIAPRVKTFAILSDETPSGRTHVKALQYLARSNALPLTLVETVATGDYESWKAKALELQNKVDAFYVVSFASLIDARGNRIPIPEIVKWYGSHITIPEATRGHYVKDGLLCAADDSGYKQAFEAVIIAQDILEKHAKPATYATKTPERGALMVNRTRANALGLTLTPAMGIEEYIDASTP